jgi:hypothetical protein
MTSIYRDRTWKISLVAVLYVCTSTVAPAAIIDNSGDSWAREGSPSGTFEGDLISVWSKSLNDAGGPNARYGSLEFDIAGQPVTAASLALWSQAYGFSDDTTPIKQTAAILSNGTLGSTAGIPSHPLSWSDIASGTLHPLETLGKYELPPVNATPEIQNAFLHSSASANDVVALAMVAAGDGRLILVLIADEDGAAYGKSWGDGEYNGNDGFLATNADVVPEPASCVLTAIGLLLAGLTIGRRHLVHECARAR